MNRTETLVCSDFDNTLAATGDDYQDQTIPQIEPIKKVLNLVFESLDKWGTDVLHVITGRPESQRPEIEAWLEQRFSKETVDLHCRPDDVPLSQLRTWKRKEVRKLVESPVLKAGNVIYFEDDAETLLEIKLVLSAHDLDYEMYHVENYPDAKSVVNQMFKRSTRTRSVQELVHEYGPPIERGHHDMDTTRSEHYRTDHYRG